MEKKRDLILYLGPGLCMCEHYQNGTVKSKKTRNSESGALLWIYR